MTHDDIFPRTFWSCPKDTPLGHLSRALGVPETFCIELSAHGWADKARVMDDLARAFSFPDYFGRNWDAVSDCLSDFRDTRPRSVTVIRDIPENPDARRNVARVAELIGLEFSDMPEHSVVLDGWERAEIQVEWPVATRVVPVRALKTS
jgi:RNAse (barnase) inhibitor barstar